MEESSCKARHGGCDLGFYESREVFQFVTTDDGQNLTDDGQNLKQHPDATRLYAK